LQLIILVSKNEFLFDDFLVVNESFNIFFKVLFKQRNENKIVEKEKCVFGSRKKSKEKRMENLTNMIK